MNDAEQDAENRRLIEGMVRDADALMAQMTATKLADGYQREDVIVLVWDASDRVPVPLPADKAALGVMAIERPKLGEVLRQVLPPEMLRKALPPTRFDVVQFIIGQVSAALPPNCAQWCVVWTPTELQIKPLTVSYKLGGGGDA